MTEAIAELALASEMMRRDIRLSPAARLVGIELLAAINQGTGEASTTRSQLAMVLGLGQSTVKRAMVQLRGAGYFDIAKGNYANRFRLRGVAT